MSARTRIRTAVRLFGALGVLLAAAAAPGLAQTRYVAFGDSITEGINFDELCTCQCREECGYPRRLEDRLQGFGINATVDNRGRGGETTPMGVTRIDKTLTQGGDVLLLMEGTNDISREVSMETTLFNLSEMARKAAGRGLSTIYATLIPRYPEAELDADNVLNRRLARGIRELAVAEGRQLIDPFEVFANTANVFERFYAVHPDDKVGHPSSAGYDLLTTVFFQVLMGFDVVPPVTGPVAPRYGAEGVSPLSQIRLWLYDLGSGVDPASVKLRVNGAEVAFAATGGPEALEIFHETEELLTSPVTVRVEARDQAPTPNAMNREVTVFTVTEDVPEPCAPDETTLCLDNLAGDSRFKITMTWETALNGGLAGTAFATPLAPVGLNAGGLLSFFERNPEVLIKVLNGCNLTDHFWIFGAPTTNLGFELVVEDTLARQQGAESSQYLYQVSNVDGEDAQPFFDVKALATCDFQ